MIVIDTSAVVELIVELGSSTRLRQQLVGEKLVAPDILPMETASALRGLNLAGHLGDDALAVAAEDFARLRVDLHQSMPLLPRALSLRHNFSAYDASYVALSEAYKCPLLTFDRRLAKAAVKHCGIEIVPA